MTEDEFKSLRKGMIISRSPQNNIDDWVVLEDVDPLKLNIVLDNLKGTGKHTQTWKGIDKTFVIKSKSACAPEQKIDGSLTKALSPNKQIKSLKDRPEKDRMMDFFAGKKEW